MNHMNHMKKGKKRGVQRGQNGGGENKRICSPRRGSRGGRGAVFLWGMSDGGGGWGMSCRR